MLIQYVLLLLDLKVLMMLPVQFHLVLYQKLYLNWQEQYLHHLLSEYHLLRLSDWPK